MEVKLLYEKDIRMPDKSFIINILTQDKLDETAEMSHKYPRQILSMLDKARDIREFTGRPGDIILLYPDRTENIYMFLGLGSRKELSPRVFQNCGAMLAKKFSNFHINEAMLDLSSNIGIEPSLTIKPFLEGIAIGAYTFSKYFTNKTPFPLGRMSIIIHDSVRMDLAEKALKDASINISASNIARHLTNEASNNKTPGKLEKLIREILRDKLFNIYTLGENELKKENLNLLYAVGKAGSEPPRLCIIECMQDKNLPLLGIVGKAVTFDSGGLMIKSKDSMPFMREDVGGAAALIGAMSVLPRLPLGFNVIAAIPIAENLIDSNSYRPSDIIITRDNISVEINNTDAEGRLMLADCFLYLQNRYKLAALIDIATLTGAITRALGKKMAGFFTNSAGFEKIFRSAFSNSLENFWQMPLEKSYIPNLRSTFADIKNDGGEPKAICAALFLLHFIKNNTPWLHLDVGSCITPGSNDILYGIHDYANGIPSITIIELFRILEQWLGNLHEAD